MDTFHTIECPHCAVTIIVYPTDIRCKVFRCGVYKKNGRPIKPHTTRDMCEKLSAEGSIYGCGKPFHFDAKSVKECDYL